MRRIFGPIALLIALSPVAALVAATFLDRGPDGSARASAFPLALAASDPFLWECARNSVAVAAVATLSSLIVGVALALAIGRRPSRARGVLAAVAVASLANPPAFGALGLERGLAALGGLDPTRFLGRLDWIFWIWAAIAHGAPLVALATSSALARVDPSWIDAARIAGAGRLRAWLDVTWPLLRPDACRAAAAVFGLTLFDPAAPWVLGLRRTLGYQALAAVRDPEAGSRAVAIGTIAAVIALVFGALIRPRGGPSWPGADPRVRPASRPGWLPSISAAATLASWSALALAPTAGLIAALAAGGDPAGSFRLILADPAVLRVLANSAILGVAVAAACALARATWPSGLAGRVVAMWLDDVPPLAIGLGVLAMPGLIRRDVGDAPSALATRALTSASSWLQPIATPWVALVLATTLVRLAATAGGAGRGGRVAASGALGDAASLGLAPRRGGWSSAGRDRLGPFFADAMNTATAITPALVLQPILGDRTLGPAAVAWVDDPEGIVKAATLAVACLVISGLATFRTIPGR